MPSTVSTNTFGVAKWVVSPDPTQGTHTTIQSAINDASSGDRILIREGIYTENLTLKAGVNLVAFSLADSQTPIVTIIGKASLTTEGFVSITGVKLQTNGDYFAEVSGSSYSKLCLHGCTLACSDFTGINQSSSHSGANIGCYNCIGNISGAGLAFYNFSSAGTMEFRYCKFYNSAASTTYSNVSSGTVEIKYCDIYFPVSTSGTGKLNIAHSGIVVGNTIPVSVSGTATSDLLHCGIEAGGNSCISIASGAGVDSSFLEVSSSATNAITGAGSFGYGTIDFTDTSKSFNVTTTQCTNGGTFTPSIQGGVTAGTATYTDRTARFWREGPRVFYAIYLAWNSATGTGTLQLTGLPITTLGVIYDNVQRYDFSLSAGSTYLRSFTFPADTKMGFEAINGQTGGISAVNVPASGGLYFQGSYEVNY